MKSPVDRQCSVELLGPLNSLGARLEWSDWGRPQSLVWLYVLRSALHPGLSCAINRVGKSI